MSLKKPRGKGRPTEYRAEYARLAEHFAMLGGTDAQLADALDVNERTVNNWKKSKPGFISALKRGKLRADVEVCHSLFRRATGYSHKAVKIFQHQGQVIERGFTEYYPPDVTACIFWMKNRAPERWRDRHDLAHTNPEGAATGITPAMIEQARVLADLVYERTEQLRRQNGASQTGNDAARQGGQ